MCLCETCKGAKAKPGTKPAKCNSCQGKGFLNYRQGAFMIRMPCESCEGQGTVLKTPCTACAGQGLRRSAATETITIPRGAESGILLKFGGKGDLGGEGHPGDLVVKVNVLRHPKFRRERNDVHSSETISIAQVTVGRLRRCSAPRSSSTPSTTPRGR